jgi:hypothetical protein
LTTIFIPRHQEHRSSKAVKVCLAIIPDGKMPNNKKFEG